MQRRRNRLASQPFQLLAVKNELYRFPLRKLQNRMIFDTH